MIDKIIERHQATADAGVRDPATGKRTRQGRTQIVFSAVGFGEAVAEESRLRRARLHHERLPRGRHRPSKSRG
jgi:hypothetical protein